MLGHGLYLSIDRNLLSEQLAKAIHPLLVDGRWCLLRYLLLSRQYLISLLRGGSPPERLDVGDLAGFACEVARVGEGRDWVVMAVESTEVDLLSVQTR